MSKRNIDKEKITQNFKIHQKDTGSTAVQIALLTEQILNLTGHINTAPKDFSAKRRMTILVNERKNFLTYLKRIDEPSFKKTVKDLEIRTNIKV